MAWWWRGPLASGLDLCLYLPQVTFRNSFVMSPYSGFNVFIATCGVWTGDNTTYCLLFELFFIFSTERDERKRNFVHPLIEIAWLVGKYISSWDWNGWGHICGSAKCSVIARNSLKVKEPSGQHINMQGITIRETWSMKTEPYIVSEWMCNAYWHKPRHTHTCISG